MSKSGPKILSAVKDTTKLSNKIEYNLVINQNARLSAGDSGLSFNGINLRSGKFEFLDARINQQSGIALTLNDSHQPILVKIQDQKATILAADPLHFAAEGLCLYNDKDNNLQVFVLGEDGLARQYLLSDSAKQLELKLIREFPVGFGVEYCAVNDNDETLFISEESVGVWRINARAESELSRQALALVKPYGPLEGVGPLAIAAGQLLIAELGSHRIHRFDLSEPELSESFAETWLLEPTTELEQLHAQGQQGATFVTFYNEADGHAYFFTKTLPNNLTNVDLPASITPNKETQIVDSFGDAADDPAIWLHPTDKHQSLILGTNKKRGLDVYNLMGNRLQHLDVGRVNNVDVRQNFSLKSQPMDVAAASQRDNNSIALFSITKSGKVVLEIEIPTTLVDVYGLCMYQGLSDLLYVFINNEHGLYQQYRIDDSASGWTGQLVREFSVPSQPEGCTVDEKTQRLFFGEEAVGVWLLGAEPNAGETPTLILPVNETLVADVEGMEIYYGKERTFLVVSSQGNDSYLVFDAHPPYAVLGRFRVSLNRNANIDGASETDGLTVTSAPLGDEYPQGILVVQDGRNLLPPESQNFKIIDWRKVMDILN